MARVRDINVGIRPNDLALAPDGRLFVACSGRQHRPCHQPVGQTRGVDSTLYTMASMIRTMELILGLPPLTQYDAGVTPYRDLMPHVDLEAKNTEASPFVTESDA